MAFGEPDVAALRRRISYRQFLEWIAYYNVEPFGEERADAREAFIAANLANCMGTLKRPAKVKDFILPVSDSKPKRQSNEEIQRMLMLYARTYQRAYDASHRTQTVNE